MTGLTYMALPPAPGLLVDFDAIGATDLVDVRDRTDATHLDLVVEPAVREDGRLDHRRGSDRTRAVRLVVDLVAAAAAMALVAAAFSPFDLWTTAVLAPVWVAALASTGAYRPRRVGHPGSEHLRTVPAAGALLALACWVATSMAWLPLADLRLLLVVAAVTGGTVGLRLCADRWIAHRSSDVAPALRVVLAGGADDVQRAAAELGRARGQRLEVVAVSLRDRGEESPVDVAVFAGLDGAAYAAAVHRADAVVVLPWPGVEPTALRRLGWQLERSNAELCVGMPLLDVAASRTRVTHAGGLRLVHVRRAALRGPRRLLKDVVERAAAALALLVLLPALLALTLAVRWDSPGPAIFRQARVGKDGRSFTMFKFRTMATDAEQRCRDLQSVNEADGVLFKLRRDPRITRLGSLLRRYSLDEVPQLANVVLGHMSLIGPRPALPSEVARYEHDPRRRMAVKPGLTGLWQVSGRSDLSWEETVRLDLDYVDNWSLGLDLRICLRTVGAVIRQRGAY